jgi:hypothetical protein
MRYNPPHKSHALHNPYQMTWYLATRRPPHPAGYLGRRGGSPDIEIPGGSRMSATRWNLRTETMSHRASGFLGSKR